MEPGPHKKTLEQGKMPIRKEILVSKKNARKKGRAKVFFYKRPKNCATCSKTTLRAPRRAMQRARMREMTGNYFTNIQENHGTPADGIDRTRSIELKKENEESGTQKVETGGIMGLQGPMVKQVFERQNGGKHFTKEKRPSSGQDGRRRGEASQKGGVDKP